MDGSRERENMCVCVYAYIYIYIYNANKKSAWKVFNAIMAEQVYNYLDNEALNFHVDHTIIWRKYEKKVGNRLYSGCEVFSAWQDACSRDSHSKKTFTIENRPAKMQIITW